MDYRTYLRNYPDQNGRFGPYGGAYLSDELKPAFEVDLCQDFGHKKLNFSLLT